MSLTIHLQTNGKGLELVEMTESWHLQDLGEQEGCEMKLSCDVLVYNKYHQLFVLKQHKFIILTTP